MMVIFTVYIFSRIFKKRELSENIYSVKISTFTVSGVASLQIGGGWRVVNWMKYQRVCSPKLLLILFTQITS